MIKFFRKIRQKLLSEYKFSKYLLYALGEIILVVVGILIALQVNNMNTNRVNKVVEKELLTLFKEALLTDKEEIIERNIRGCDRRITLINALITSSKTGKSVPDSLQNNYQWLMRHLEFRPIVLPYKILESKGLDLIQNKELQHSLINLYSMEYGRIQLSIENEVFNLRDVYRPIFKKHFDVIPEGQPKYQIVDFTRMIKDREFMNAIGIIYSNNAWIKKLLEDQQIIINEMIEQIDLELE